jgi:hypothetical protein
MYVPTHLDVGLVGKNGRAGNVERFASLSYVDLARLVFTILLLRLALPGLQAARPSFISTDVCFYVWIFNQTTPGGVVYTAQNELYIIRSSNIIIMATL